MREKNRGQWREGRAWRKSYGAVLSERKVLETIRITNLYWSFEMMMVNLCFMEKKKKKKKKKAEEKKKRKR